MDMPTTSPRPEVPSGSPESAPKQTIGMRIRGFVRGVRDGAASLFPKKGLSEEQRNERGITRRAALKKIGIGTGAVATGGAAYMLWPKGSGEVTPAQMQKMDRPTLNKQLDQLLEPDEIPPEIRAQLSDDQVRDLIKLKQEERKASGDASTGMSDVELDAHCPDHLRNAWPRMTRDEKLSYMKGRDNAVSMQKKIAANKDAAPSGFGFIENLAFGQVTEAGIEAARPTLMMWTLKVIQLIGIAINSIQQTKDTRLQAAFEGSTSKEMVQEELKAYRERIQHINNLITNGTLTTGTILLALETLSGASRLFKQFGHLEVGRILGNLASHVIWWKLMVDRIAKAAAGDEKYYQSQWKSVTTIFERKLNNEARELNRVLAGGTRSSARQARPSTSSTIPPSPPAPAETPDVPTIPPDPAVPPPAPRTNGTTGLTPEELSSD